MAKKGKGSLYGLSHDELFGEITNDIQREIFHDAPGRYRENDEDSEDFFTSEDIVKKNREVQVGEGLKTIDEIEEEAVFKRFTQRRKHKYTETEMAAIRESCLKTIVHDYGDMDNYHMSDEERARGDQLNEMRDEIAKLKRIYHRPDQWVEAMRIVYDAWVLLSKRNYIHTREEFFGLVSNGKIVSPRITMPILKKADKYNMEKLIMYISNPDMDVKHLVPKDQDDKDKKRGNYFDDDDDFFGIGTKKRNEVESFEEKAERLLSDEELEYAANFVDNPERMEVKPVKQKLIKGYDKRNWRKNKKRKKVKKSEKYEREQISALMKNIQNGSHYKKQGASYMITNNLFEPEKVEKDFIYGERYNASWQDDESVKIYDIVLMEELMKQRVHKDRHMTYGDKFLDNFFTTMENEGVNTIDLRQRMNHSPERVANKQAKVDKKQNKKTESALIQRITKLNGNKRFKKLIDKAENELNEFRKENW